MPKQIHHVAQAHDAQADAAGAIGGFGYFRNDRHIGIGRDHIVEEVGALIDRAAQQLPIHHCRAISVVRHMHAQVDRAEAAIFIRAKPLLAARVCRLQRIEMGHGVRAIGGVNKERAGLAVVVCIFDDLVKEIAGAHAPPDLAIRAG